MRIIHNGANFKIRIEDSMFILSECGHDSFPCEIRKPEPLIEYILKLDIKRDSKIRMIFDITNYALDKVY